MVKKQMVEELLCILEKEEKIQRGEKYMMNNFDLILGYDYDEWYGYGRSKPFPKSSD